MSATISFFVSAAAVAGRFSATDNAVDYRSGTADALVYIKRPEGAIGGTSPAFHTLVLIQNDRLFALQCKNSMRAYLNAHSAANAQIRKELKTRNF
jgi:hypothetical protein